jgi:hypothetical protein
VRVSLQNPRHLQLQLANAGQHLIRRDSRNRTGAALEVEHGIDDHCLAAAGIVGEICIGAGQRVIEGFDRSIPLPGGYRIGLDAIIGLVPGLGDAVGALVSAYIINEARSLGAPRSILLRMLGNVAIETVVGAIPFAGDLFDAAFKANTRNLALLARYQLDPIGSRRSSRFFVFGFSLLLAAVVAFMIAVPVLVIVALFKLY